MAWNSSRTSKADIPKKKPAPTGLTPAQAEQRRAVRILFHDLKIMYDGCTDWVDVRSPDLSTGGLFINTPHTFAKGTKLKLRFDLPGSGVLVQAVGEVRYCLPGMGVGVEFVNLPDFARSAIQKEVDETSRK
jgi:hypothetical protein